MTIIALCGCLTFGYSCFDITVMVLKPSPLIRRNSERGGMYTFRASFSGTFLQTLPELVTPLKGNSFISAQMSIPRRQQPTKGLGIYICVKTNGLHQGHPSSFALVIILSPSSVSGSSVSGSSISGPSVSGTSVFETAKAKTDGTGGYPQDGKALRRRAHPS